jgi:hypothetical protein
VLEIRRAQTLRPDHGDPYRNRKFGIMSGSSTTGSEPSNSG